MKNRKLLNGLLTLSLGLGLTVRAEAADTPMAADAAVSQPSLDQRVDVLEKSLAGMKPAPGMGALAKGSPDAPGFGGIGFYTSEGTYGVQFGALLQEDSRTYGYDGINTSKGLTSPLINGFVNARARFLMDAFLGSKVHLRYQEDFSNNGNNSGVTGASDSVGGNGPLLIDAYGELKLLPWTILRVGQIKTPLGLERWRPTPALDFLQFGYTSGLMIDRTQGALVEIADPKQALYLAAGAIDGATDSGSTPVVQAYNSNKDLVARLFVQPFNGMSNKALGDLGLGAAGTAGNHTFAPELGYKSLGQQAIVNPTVGNVLGTFTEGAGYRVAPQAYWFWDNFSLLSEYVHETQGYRIAATSQNKITTSEAWQAQVGWVPTGERTSFSGLKLNDKSWGIGAFELVGRVQGANYDEGAHTAYSAGGLAATSKGLIDPETSVTSLQSWSLGLNYVPVNDVEFLVDWDRTVFTNGGAGAPLNAQGHPTGAFVTANRPTEEVLQARAQLAF